jgi:type III restriction enzyme
MQLKIYQENAVEDLLNKTKKLLGYSDGKKLVFKAPTGSGKTIMMAEFLKQLSDDKEIKQSLGFIWTAPRQLHIQSKEKLETYFEANQAMKCSYFDDLDDRIVGENEILFFNWSSVNKKDKNTIVKENEQEFYLSKVIERTKEEGRKIILIIDEVHYSAGQLDQKELSAAAQLRKDINPDLTIEVSATPLLEGDEDVKIQIEEVKAEAMIKKGLILNEGFNNLFKGGKIETNWDEDKNKDSDELVIDRAMKKRAELLASYKKEGVDINPLVLIQMPRNTGQADDLLRDKIERILKDKYKISSEKGNNKLAIWLSGEHVNKENIERIDGKVDVLIFKEAIALGWDCPRAQIIALFRQWHKPVFTIQTVGRIMRMPEPSRGTYYGEDHLNYGYIFTNLTDIILDKDIASGYVSFRTSKRRADYESIDLLSYYPKRHREKTRLSTLFTGIFLNEAKKYGLKSKIDTKARKIGLKIISDFKAEDIDRLVGQRIVGDKPIKIGEGDLQKLFDYFVRNNLSPFHPEDRSIARVKEAIYKFFEVELNKHFRNYWEEIVEIVLDDENSHHFVNVLNEAKEEYKNEVVKRESEMVKVEKWNIPESLPFSEAYEEIDAKKSILQPVYVKYGSEAEREFVDILEKSSEVNWWFKNGDRDSTFFAIPYGDGEIKPFYVDFIVKMKDGRIGLFDPHGAYLADFKSKEEGLNKYIKQEQKRGKKIFGGVIADLNKFNFESGK